MNSALLQNSDVTLRLLILAIPSTAAFLFSVFYILVIGRTEETDNQPASLFLSICATSFLYMVLEIIIILFTDNVPMTAILKQSVYFYALLSILNAASCLIKGIVGGKRLKYITGEDKEQAMARSLIYMSIAELPSLISLVLYLLTFFTE